MWRETDTDRKMRCLMASNRGLSLRRGRPERPGAEPLLITMRNRLAARMTISQQNKGESSISGISDMRLDCSAALPASAFAAGR